MTRDISADLLAALTIAKQGTSARAVALPMKMLGFRPVQGRAPLLGKVRGWIKSTGENLAICSRLVPSIASNGQVDMHLRALPLPPPSATMLPMIKAPG
jgi:hypothetical protein